MARSSSQGYSHDFNTTAGVSPNRSRSHCSSRLSALGTPNKGTLARMAKKAVPITIKQDDSRSRHRPGVGLRCVQKIRAMVNARQPKKTVDRPRAPLFLHNRTAVDSRKAPNTHSCGNTTASLRSNLCVTFTFADLFRTFPQPRRRMLYDSRLT